MVDRDTWNGSDIFMAQDRRTEYIVTTKKIYDAFAKANVTNVLLQDVTQVRRAA